MHILIAIILVIAGFVALLLIIALFLKKEYNVRREITINAPKEIVFAYLKLLRNQENYNKWLMATPNMIRNSKGTDGTVGFIYSWGANKHGGAGEQEIVSVNEGQYIESQIRFSESFVGISPRIIMKTESVSANQTKVTWSNGSKLKYPVNIMLSLTEKMLTKDLDMSLSKLKAILEK